MTLVPHAVKIVVVIVDLESPAEAVMEAAVVVVATSDLPSPKNLFPWVVIWGAPDAVVALVVDP